MSRYVIPGQEGLTNRRIADILVERAYDATLWSKPDGSFRFPPPANPDSEPSQTVVKEFWVTLIADVEAELERLQSKAEARFREKVDCPRDEEPEQP